MKILLLNQNATVEKLISLSAQKVGYELESVEDYHEVSSDDYKIVIVDSDMLENIDLDELKERILEAKYFLLLPKESEKVDGFDFYVEKPFLPTELVTTFASLDVQTSKPDFKREVEDMGEKKLQSTKNEDATLNDLDIDFNLDEDDGLADLDLDDIMKEDTKDDNKKSAKEDDEFDMDLQLDEDQAHLDTDLNLEEDDAQLDIDLTSEDDLLLDEDKKDSSILSEDDIGEVKELLEDTDMQDSALNDEDLSFLDESSDSLKDEELRMDFGSNNALMEEYPVDVESDLGDTSDTIDEVKDALDEVEEMDEATLDDDLLGLDEENLAAALGETVPQSEKKESFATKAKKEQNIKEEAVGAMSKTITQAIASMPIGNLRELLDGMELTIKISFPDKK